MKTNIWNINRCWLNVIKRWWNFPFHNNRGFLTGWAPRSPRKSCHFVFISLRICQSTKCLRPTWNGICVAASSDVRTVAAMVLTMVRNVKVRQWEVELNGNQVSTRPQNINVFSVKWDRPLCLQCAPTWRRWVCCPLDTDNMVLCPRKICTKSNYQFRGAESPYWGDDRSSATQEMSIDVITIARHWSPTWARPIQPARSQDTL
jgi:hypothetical protein